MTEQNTEIIEMTDGNGNPKIVVKIQNGDNDFTWMDKSVYDEMIAKQI
jgi:3-dehydroquinate synthase class II